MTEVLSWFKPPEYKSHEISTLLNDLYANLEDAGESKTPNTVSGKESIESVKTLTNVSFTIKYPESRYLLDEVLKNEGPEGVEFILTEANEWVADTYDNPGKAWEAFPSRWKHSLNSQGKMDYTYHERLHSSNQIFTAINELISNPDTRQAYIAIYEPKDALNVGKEVRVPCLVGYQLDIDPQANINMTAILRSCDLQNCLANDIYLAYRLQTHIADAINFSSYSKLSYLDVSLGSLTFMISNLHRYPKIDV